MEWEQKIEMCELGQRDDLEPFKNYVNTYIDSFDMQAWDMFLTVFSITKDNVLQHSKFLINLLPRLELFDSKHGNDLSLRTNFRLAVLISKIKELQVES